MSVSDQVATPAIVDGTPLFKEMLANQAETIGLCRELVKEVGSLKGRLVVLEAEHGIFDHAHAAEHGCQPVTTPTGAADEGPGLEESVIARLTASLKLTSEKDYREGAEAGAAWAKHRAEAGELRRLYDAKTMRLDSEWETSFRDEEGSPHSPTLWLFGIINGESKPRPSDSLAFWRYELGIEQHARIPDEFLRGFADAAIDVWEDFDSRI